MNERTPTLNHTPSIEDTLERHTPTGREWECECGAMHATRRDLTAHIADMVRAAAYTEIAKGIDSRLADTVHDAVSNAIGDLERDLTGDITAAIRNLI